MKSMLVAAAIIAAAGTGSVASGGVITTVSRDNSSASEALRRAGCREGWLSQVLLDSRIKPSERNRLPKGKELVLKSHSCQDVPSRAVREATRLLERPPVQVVRTSGVEPEVVEELRVSLSKARAEASQNLERAKTAESKLSQAPPSVVTVQVPTPASRSSLFWAFLVGAVLAGAAGFILSRSRDSKLARAPIRKTVWLGKNYTFTLTDQRRSGKAYEGRYQCDGCGESNLPGDEASLKKHLQDKHAADRTSTVT